LHNVQQVHSVHQDLKQDVCLMETTHGMMHRQCFLQERLV
jgi:hypothetical protein